MLCFLCESNRIENNRCIDCEALQIDQLAYETAISQTNSLFQCPIIVDIKTWTRCQHKVPANTQTSYRCPECNQHINKIMLFRNNSDIWNAARKAKAT